MIKSFWEFISEANRTLPYSYFAKVMNDLGFEYRGNQPTNFFTKVVKDGDGKTHNFTVMSHIKHPDKTVDAAAWTEMKDAICGECEVTGNFDMFDKIDWSVVGIADPRYSKGTSIYKLWNARQEINNYEIVDKVFKGVYVIKNKEDKYNLCGDENDKTPILDKWYEMYTFNRKGKRCLGYGNYDMDSEDFGEHLFEIKPDGTLGHILNVDYVIESKNLEKS